MQEFLKRVKSGAWVAFGGFVATLLTLTLQHIDAFDLSENGKLFAVILLTAIVTQITKWLNTKK